MESDQHQPDWRLLTEFHQGLTSCDQTAPGSLSVWAVRRRYRSGRWMRVHRGVYATFTGTPTREAKLWAAVLRAGLGAMLSHETAAEVQGLSDRPSPKIHITVPSARNPARTHKIPGVVIHRSDQSRADWQPPWQLPRTRVEDTVLDLVNASRTFDDAYAWISRALSRRQTTAGLLRQALGTRKKIRWRTWLTEAFDDVGDGIHFPLERRYVRNVERAHGLPAARRQARHRRDGKTHYKDSWYEDYGVCVELDGSAYHPPEQMWQDKHRDNANLAAGDIRTFRFGMVDVTERACDSAVYVASALRRGGWPGQPRPCGPACPVSRS